MPGTRQDTAIFIAAAWLLPMVAIHLAAALKARTPGESMGLLAELFDLSGLIFSGIYDIHVPFCIFYIRGLVNFTELVAGKI